MTINALPPASLFSASVHDSASCFETWLTPKLPFGAMVIPNWSTSYTARVEKSRDALTARADSLNLRVCPALPFRGVRKLCLRLPRSPALAEIVVD